MPASATFFLWLFAAGLIKALTTRCEQRYPLRLVLGLTMIGAIGFTLITLNSHILTYRSILVSGVTSSLLLTALIPLIRAERNAVNKLLIGVICAVAVINMVRLVIIYGLWQAELSVENYSISAYVWAHHLSSGISSLGLAVALMVAAGYDSIIVHQRRSNIDPLTGLLNLRGFYDAFGEIGDPGDGERLRGFLLQLDLDDFKQINDNFGHPTGDLVLKRVAEVLASGTEYIGVAARTGGEEFTIILKVQDFDRAHRISQHLKGAIACCLNGEIGSGKNVTASFGLTMIGPNCTLEMVRSRADKALYQAKKKGKNRVEFDPDLIKIGIAA